MRRTHKTSTTKPSLLSRLTHRKRGTVTKKTTITTTESTHAHTTRSSRRDNNHTTGLAAPAHHRKRRPSLGDKVSGAMMKLRGSLTRRPGLKAAGTRRAHGTDGRGARRVGY
ncbi:MAG: hypothetical protein MMC23_005385 [Stictis urceolatum]|nr:hypothetical protein [Stictis urceolata]